MKRIGSWIMLASLVAAIGAFAWWVSLPGGTGPDAEILDTGAEAEAPPPSPAELAAAGTRGTGAGRRRIGVPRGEGAIVGTVRRTGEPVAAEVFVHVIGAGVGFNPWGRAAADRPFTPPPRSEEAAAVVRAGEDGRFSVPDLGPGAFHLVAVTADGARGAALAMLVADGARVEVYVVVSGGAESLRGRILWADGRPFAGSAVLATQADGYGFWGLPQGRLLSLDPEGRFTASGLPAGSVTLTAIAEDRLAFTSPPVVLPRAEEFVFTVDAGLASVAGQVVREDDGKPVAGADVTCSASSGQGAVTSRATTDAEGSFQVQQSSQGHAWLSVRAEGFVSWNQQRDAGSAAKGPLVVRLTRGATVTGRVTQDGNGAPVAGLNVAVHLIGTRDMGTSSEPASTDSDGRYTVTGVAAGEAMVVATGPGVVTKGLEQASSRGYNPLVVNLKAGETSTVDLVVTAGARVEGTVFDAAGAPVVGAVVRCQPMGPPLSWQGLGQFSGSASGRDGHYVVDTALPGLSHNLRAEAPGFTTANAGPVTPSVTMATTQDIRFTSARFVDVTVLDDAAGSPVAGARLEGSWGGGGPFGGSSYRLTDSGGRARVGPLADGQQQLRVSALGYVSEGVMLSEKETTKVLRLKPGFDVAGRVLWPDGTPAGAVYVTGGQAGTAGATSGADGAFTVRGLPAGEVALSAQTPKDGQMLTAFASVSAGSKDVVLRLGTGVEARASLTVRVFDAQGRPVPSAHAQLRSKSGSNGTLVREGRVTFDSINPTEVDYTVEVWSARAADGSPLPLGPASQRVPPGAREIDLTMPAELTASGTVKGPDGAPIRGVVVQAQAISAGEERNRWDGGPQSRTNEAGEFRVGGLAAEEYELTFLTPPGFAPVPPVRVRGGDAGVSVRLKAGASVTVTVVDPDGKPVAGVQVSASLKPKVGRSPAATSRFDPRSVGGPGATMTDASGAARLTGLDSDVEYSLQVSGKGDDFGRASVDPWSPRDETVRLPRVWALSGVIVDRAGKPVPNTWIMQKTGQGWSGGANTDAEGRFRLRGLPAGDVVLRPTIPGAMMNPNDASGEVRVAAGSKDVVLTIDTGLELVVRIENSGDLGAPHVAALLRVRRGGETHQQSTNGDVGEAFRFRGLQAGDEVTFWIQGPDPEVDRCVYATGLQPGGEVRVRVVAGHSIRGTVKAPAGATQIRVNASRDGLSAHGMVEPSGAFVFHGLPQGTAWDVTAAATPAAGGTRIRGQVSANAGDTGVVIEVKPPEPTGGGK